MLHFLRRIRRNLIDDQSEILQQQNQMSERHLAERTAKRMGRIKKYFLYAVGEILLVMIGILLALQVNNWNESRREARQEGEYLTRLLSEIQLDTLTFSQEITNNISKNKQITGFTGLLKDPDSNDSLLIAAAIEYFRSSWFIPHFNPSTSTFDDLSSTGKLNVINNKSLRESIVEFYASYQELTNSYTSNREWMVPIDAKLTSSEADVLKHDSRTLQIFEQFSTKERAGDLRKNKAIYIRNAATHYWVNDYAVESLGRKIKEGDQIIKLIEKEL